jgi:hypothetical protein
MVVASIGKVRPVEVNDADFCIQPPENRNSVTHQDELGEFAEIGRAAKNPGRGYHRIDTKYSLVIFYNILI